MTAVNYSAAGTFNSFSLDEVRKVVQSARKSAEPAARKAIQLDPSLAEGYQSLAGIQQSAGKFIEAEELSVKAHALDPSVGYARLLMAAGRVKEALVMRQEENALEPFIPFATRNLAVALWVNGEDDAALALFKTVPLANRYIALVHAAAGRFNEAAETLLSAPSGTYSPDVLKEAVRLLRAAPTTVAPEHPVPLGPVDFVYLFVGAPDRVLNYYERNVDAGWMLNAQNDLLWHPSYAPARKTERFKVLVRKMGFVDYWRVKGWPEFCRPTTGDDFECN
jgi:tetratricopeptide (TPR) repeat protein